MTIDDKIQLTLQDLRAIIHGLKMASLSFVEPDALDSIRARIKNLPGAERLNKMGEYPISLKDLQKEIGEIMRLMELYSKRDAEFKARHKSRTGLPPRYKVLEWREIMKQKANELIKELVKVSAAVDERGHGQIAGKLIKCAKAVQQNDIKENDIPEVIDELKKAGFEKEAELIKEAQGLWGGVKEVGKGLWQGVKGLGQGIKEMYQVGKYNTVLNNINNQISQILPSIQQAAQATQNPDRKSRLTNIFYSLANMKTIADKIGGDFRLVVEEEQRQATQPAGQSPAAAPAGQAQPQESFSAFQKGQPLKYNQKDVIFETITPDGKNARVRYNNSPWMVPLEALIKQNQVGGVAQEKTPVGAPAKAPVPASSMFNLKKYSKK